MLLFFISIYCFILFNYLYILWYLYYFLLLSN